MLANRDGNYSLAGMRKPTTSEWMGAAFIVALAIAFVVLMGAKPGHKLGAALRATARWSYLWFWPAYAGGALAALFGPRFQALAHRGRDFGLAFASAHLVHVGVVALLLYIEVKPFPRGSLIFFGIGVFWIYLLALLSVRSLAQKLSPRVVRIVRTIGVEYIAFAFLVDFAKNPFKGGAGHLLAYLPFLGLAVAGPLLRLTATAKRSGHAWGLAA